MAMQLPDDFKEFLKLLNDHDVEYLMIGGYAVGYHGYVRATNDLDVWVSAESRNVQKLSDALLEFGLPSSALGPGLFADASILRIGVPPLRIEVMSDVSGVAFDACYATRLIDEVDDVTVHLIDREALKANKRASARYKDLDDLEHLE